MSTETMTIDQAMTHLLHLACGEGVSLHRLALTTVRNRLTWQPIATAPKNGKRILVSEYSGYVHLVQWCSAGYWRNRIEDGDLDWSPVLWMPYEEPPELNIEEAREAIAISRAIPVSGSALEVSHD